jgi:hypothetical protein
MDNVINILISMIFYIFLIEQSNSDEFGTLKLYLIQISKFSFRNFFSSKIIFRNFF